MVDPEMTVAEAEWGADVMWGDPPPVIATSKTNTKANPAPPEPEAGTASAPVDLDLGADGPPVPEGESRVDANAGAKRVATVLGVGLVGAVALIVGTLLSFGNSDDPPTEPAPVHAAVTAPEPPPSAAAPAADQDQAVAFTASADCPAGSTSAQTLTDTTRDSAWVCVRGPAGAAVDGQVLHIDFGTSHVLTAVAVTPGWVAKTTGGRDEWLQHRVVSRLQYCFNDDDHTIVTQDTGNAHGPVTLPLPHPVLASQVTVIILQTARPPASPLPSTDPGNLPGLPDTAQGVGPAGQEDVPAQVPTADLDPNGDPVDATFAMSGLQFFGHPPK